MQPGQQGDRGGEQRAGRGGLAAGEVPLLRLLPQPAQELPCAEAAQQPPILLIGDLGEPGADPGFKVVQELVARFEPAGGDQGRAQRGHAPARELVEQLVAHHTGVVPKPAQQLGAGVGQPAQSARRGGAGQRGEHRFQPVGDGTAVDAEQVMQLVQVGAAGAQLPLIEPFDSAALDAGPVIVGVGAVARLHRGPSARMPATRMVRPQSRHSARRGLQVWHSAAPLAVRELTIRVRPQWAHGSLRSSLLEQGSNCGSECW